MIKQPKNKMADKAVPNASAVSGKKDRQGTGLADPELLIADLSRPQMFRMLVYALLIHILVIGATSIGFISLCVKYHSMRPRQVVRALEKEATEKKMKEDAAKATEDAIKASKAAAEEANKKAKANPAPAKAAGTDNQPPPADNGTPSGQPEGKKKSKIEQEVEKTSSERPTKPSVGLDMTPDLE